MSDSLGFFEKLKNGLSKTKDNFIKNIDYAFNGFSSIDEDFYEELEETLIMGDIGVSTTQEILDELRTEVNKNKVKEPTECRQLLINCISAKMHKEEISYRFEEVPSVVLVVGVNGVGKTTTIGKLASKYKNSGKRVMIAACDTFRAAATEQLKEWANRAGVDMVGGSEGSDPGSVAFDALASAKAKKADILLIDTAGRLHNKKNLMDELSKINRIIDREYPDAYKETLVVVDATTGQNALVQAEEFSKATGIDGLVLTKMDGSAKGGIAVAIASKLDIPVKYIGVGEGVDDLEKFDSQEFVKALFD